MTKYITNIQEFVMSGHPDKFCDQVADRILDKHLEQDKNAKVAIEVSATKGLILISGEITSTAKVNFVKEARFILKEHYYKLQEYIIQVNIQKQSPELNKIVQNQKTYHTGDQAIVYGYAFDDRGIEIHWDKKRFNTKKWQKNGKKMTSTIRPNIYNDFVTLHAWGFSNQKASFLPPAYTLARSWFDLMFGGGGNSIWDIGRGTHLDGKLKIETDLIYKELFIKSLIVNFHFDKEVAGKNLLLFEKKIKAGVWKVENPKITNNDFVKNASINTYKVGGLDSDSGVTGRKLMLDTYGNGIPHGGGAFSGKDPTKVDRTGAYYARWIAKHLCAANYGKEILVRLSYGIDSEYPDNITIQGLPDLINSQKLYAKFFKLTFNEVIEKFDLFNVNYESLSSRGHFGIEDFTNPWEELDKALLTKLADYLQGDK